jgi:hypothetical protein
MARQNSDGTGTVLASSPGLIIKGLRGCRIPQHQCRFPQLLQLNATVRGNRDQLPSMFPMTIALCEAEHGPNWVRLPIPTGVFEPGLPARCSRLPETTAGGVAETKNCDSGHWRIGDWVGERDIYISPD